MDDLEFRRRLYENPNSNDQELLQAVAADSKKHDFMRDLRKLDQKMYAASQIDVPADLASKLILRQTMHSHAVNKKRSRVHLALAASVAFVAGISFTMWQQSNLINMSEHAIAHVVAEGNYALGANEDISLQQVNAKLASFGGELSENVGQIYYANFCDFDEVRSLHMVMNIDGQKVTVFVVPKGDEYDASGSLSQGNYESQSIELQKANLVVVGEEGTDVTQAKKMLSKKIRFSV